MWNSQTLNAAAVSCINEYIVSPKSVSVSCCRSSSPQCSQEAAVRFTSWLLDKTHCSAGNNWTWNKTLGSTDGVRLRYSEFSWWCLFVFVLTDVHLHGQGSSHKDQQVISGSITLSVCPLPTHRAELIIAVDAEQMLESVTPSMSTETWIVLSAAAAAT